MACRRLSGPGAAAVFACGAFAPLAAQVTAVVANLGYQAPRLVAPAVVLYRVSASGDDAWTFALVGATLSAEHTRNLSPALSNVVSVEVAAYNSNSSEYAYVDGKRDPAVEFRDRSVRLGAGLQRQHGPQWRTEIRAIGLYESVSGLADAGVAARWTKPYLGLSIETRYQHVISDDLFQARWDGLKVSGSAQGFVGSRAWWRGQLSLGAGKSMGRVILRGRAWVLGGGGLDVVNQHLVGGCWDLAGTPTLYGYHYAEFRLDRAVVLGGGADLRLAGSWELGLRAGYLDSPSHTTYGEAVRLSGVWKGIGMQVGMGFPKRGESLLFAALSAGVL